MAVVTVGDKIRQLVEWAPALSIVSEISGAQTAQERIDAALKLMRFVASKTGTHIDDDLLERIQAVLMSQAGRELVDYVVKLATAVSLTEVPE
jgi:hypothetical protein